ncbi:hypothetical protein HanHA300_Chr01g0006131 [Helianthus annuus]|nr:hypothetical protein HanHA300_Chr01g0006131 [Helianthus annuus]KAJ0625897.1 hypothetical protein HanHA89_Chr01g0006781 [Helianthus annuus]KAJ0782253.1 hypothetical protein HanLR1_Chr01g0005971 [Helianthus annuus]
MVVGGGGEWRWRLVATVGDNGGEWVTAAAATVAVEVRWWWWWVVAKVVGCGVVDEWYKRGWNGKKNMGVEGMILREWNVFWNG